MPNSQLSTQYLTDFESMMLDFISENNVTQYSDEESSVIFQNINSGIDPNFNYEHKKLQADAESSLKEVVLNS